MALEVDTKNISLQLKDIELYLKKYIENNEDFFYELSKISSYWKDDDLLLFEDMVNEDKINYNLVTENLDKVISIYKKIHDMYD